MNCLPLLLLFLIIIFSIYHESYRVMNIEKLECPKDCQSISNLVSQYNILKEKIDSNDKDISQLDKYYETLSEKVTKNTVNLRVINKNIDELNQETQELTEEEEEE